MAVSRSRKGSLRTSLLAIPGTDCAARAAMSAPLEDEWRVDREGVVRLRVWTCFMQLRVSRTLFDFFEPIP